MTPRTLHGGILLWLLIAPFDLLVTVLSMLFAPLIAIGSAEPLFVESYGNLPRYLRCILWLWRNPCYGWTWTVTAITADPSAEVRIYGDTDTSNRPIWHPGWRIIVCGGAWELYWVAPSLFGRCVRARLGWKLTHLTDPARRTETGQFVLSINPLMGRS